MDPNDSHMPEILLFVILSTQTGLTVRLILSVEHQKIRIPEETS